MDILNTKMRIFVDMDGVIADLLEKWLEEYNLEYDDTLKYEDIIDWDLRKSVKKEAIDTCNNIFKRPGLYRNLSVIENSQKAVKTLMDMGYEVFILTDPFTKYSLRDKWEWLEEYFPFIDTRHYIFTGNKSVVGDGFLIDDGIHNLQDFGGIGILFDTSYNKGRNDYIRVKEWSEIVYFFKIIKNLQKSTQDHF